MFLRMLGESFLRQRRRKLLAGVAILLGTTAVTAMLALATTIGDRIHKELAVYGANIVVYPKADLLDVKVGGVDVKPASGGAYLKESDLEKLKGIFWANNITGVSPELPVQLAVARGAGDPLFSVKAVGYWFDHDFGGLKTGAVALHPWRRLQGARPLRGGDVGGGVKSAVRRVQVSARTKPADAFARVDQDSLSPPQCETWCCRQYANSIAYQ